MLTGHKIKSNVYRWSKRLLGAKWVTNIVEKEQINDGNREIC